MMDQASGWMGGWSGGGISLLAVLGIVVVVLLIVMVARK